jgi:hypothetical protein
MASFAMLRLGRCARNVQEKRKAEGYQERSGRICELLTADNMKFSRSAVEKAKK